MPSKESEAIKRYWTAVRLAGDQPDHEPPDVETSNDAWGSLTAEPRGVDYLETDAGGLPAMWAVPKQRRGSGPTVHARRRVHRRLDLLAPQDVRPPGQSHRGSGVAL
jgi:hypothetical protein